MSILFSHFFQKNNEISPQEHEYTEVLSSIALTPKKLYFYGKIPEKRVKTVAIVGTRRYTKYGENIAYSLAYALAKCGVIVVSGLAYGIDSIAHKGAVDAGGVTLAILGTPIDYIYPKAHVGLAAEIIKKQGAVVSELPEGAEYNYKECFLRRNRIISGLADAVVIVEAAERSGSLNTAMHALDQGKDVFAVPGDITRLTSKGCNNLIAQGAFPYTGVEDVLERLLTQERAVGGSVKMGKTRRSSKKVGQIAAVGEDESNLHEGLRQCDIDKMKVRAVYGALSGIEEMVVRELLSGETEGERILEATKISPAEFNRAIVALELKDLIMPLGDNQWALKKIVE